MTPLARLSGGLQRGGPGTEGLGGQGTRARPWGKRGLCGEARSGPALGLLTLQLQGISMPPEPTRQASTVLGAENPEPGRLPGCWEPAVRGTLVTALGDATLTLLAT